MAPPGRVPHGEDQGATGKRGSEREVGGCGGGGHGVPRFARTRAILLDTRRRGVDACTNEKARQGRRASGGARGCSSRVLVNTTLAHVVQRVNGV